MRTPKLTRITQALMTVGALSASSWVCAASGSFNFVTGEVTLVRLSGQRVAATQGTEVSPGDTVITGRDGMAQLTMIDQARLSLRPNSEFKVESYAQKADANDGAVLSLVKGTLRAFTGLIASRNKDKFVMKTRVATVGIRGSGNILHTCVLEQCEDDLRPGGMQPGDEVTVQLLSGEAWSTRTEQIHSGAHRLSCC